MEKLKIKEQVVKEPKENKRILESIFFLVILNGFIYYYYYMKWFKKKKPDEIVKELMTYPQDFINILFLTCVNVGVFIWLLM